MIDCFAFFAPLREIFSVTVSHPEVSMGSGNSPGN